MIYTIGRYFNLVRVLTATEFKLRDQGSMLGFFWTLLHPMAMFCVLYVVFSKWMVGHVKEFPSYLFVGIVMWNFFSTATSNALDIISRKAELVKNISFPKEILVVSSVLSIFLSFILEITVLLVVLICLGIRYGPVIVYFPFIVVIELILVVAVSLILSSLHVRYRDIRRIWDIIIRLGFFLTPIFYPLSIISSGKQRIMMYNPMLHVINASRECLLYQNTPHLMGLGVVLAVSIILLIAGLWIFKRAEVKFAEII